MSAGKHGTEATLIVDFIVFLAIIGCLLLVGFVTSALSEEKHEPILEKSLQSK